jgi:hypothetical protein
VSWGFLIWGGIHGLGLALWRLFEPKGRGPRVALARWKKVLGVALTLHVVLFAWIFFRCDSLEQAGQVLSRLGDLSGGHGNLPADALALILATFVLQWLPEGLYFRLRDSFLSLPSPVQGLALVGVALLVRGAAGAKVAAFIYQGF